MVGCRDAILPMAISDPNQPDNPIVYVNPAFEALTGYAREEVLGRNCRFLQGPMSDGVELARLRDAIGKREKVSVDLLNYRKDGSPFWNRLLITPVCEDDGTLRYFFASQHDVTAERERVTALEAEQLVLLADAEQTRARLADSEARLHFALKAGQLGTWALDPATHHLDASSSCKGAFGYDPEATFGFAEFQATVHPDDRPLVLAAVEATTTAGAPYDIEYRILTPAGEQRWIAAQGELLKRRDGSPLSMTGFVTDISARKHAEDHRRLLAGELTHRVKNTLATVSAVVNQTLRNAASLEEASAVVGGRIASLATAHELLLRDEVEGATVADIVAGVLRPFDGGDGNLYTARGPDIRLSPAVTLALSMALHELATNAAKYGALSTTGTVAIRWDLIGQNEMRRFSFSWIEQGGPPVTPPTRTGFGSRMIERVMAQHIRGSASIDYRPEGVTFTIDAPM
ncbi:PAS domain S-box protein [Sphingomonas bacterium]|uniref:PAS domain S-box protein n=1 Tax=Sphingomonas bacterium TaxID=1895847 RepID=UPI0026709F3F|nr:PAS domain S-box protein [Sphingomonas bacterium]